jgi:diacylglycerol kinase family enzyme
MAHELGIPLDLKKAVEMLVTSPKHKAVDLARIGGKYFMLRAYAGFNSDEAASREQKNKYGQLAYIQASMKFLKNKKPTHFRATIDGEVVEGKALICFILNAGSIGGVLGVSLPKIGMVSSSDGYVDLYAVTKGVQPLRAVTHHLFDVGKSEAGIYHWKGREIKLEADPVQEVWLDGELGGTTPFTIQVVPRALEIAVPA